LNLFASNKAVGARRSGAPKPDGAFKLHNPSSDSATPFNNILSHMRQDYACLQTATAIHFAARGIKRYSFAWIKKEAHLAQITDVSPGFLKALFQGLATVKIRRSALAPFLSACLYVTVPCFLIAILCPDPLRYCIVGLGSIPLLLFGVASLFLLFRDRDRLHTEEYLERRHALEIVEAKGQGMLLSSVDLVNMVNPQPDRKKLPTGAQEEEVSNG
jgi:hypothetical protein